VPPPLTPPRTSPPRVLPRLEILSLARNNITRIEGLEPVAATLQQLWLSYNMVSKLEGLKALPQLKVLYLANNLIRDVKELENLPPSLEARARAHAIGASQRRVTFP
jgi:dynein light chain 1